MDDQETTDENPPHDDEDHLYDHRCPGCIEDGPPDTQFDREVYGPGYAE